MSKEMPPPPDLLPNYLSKGLPTQDLETLSATHDWIEELIELMEQPVEDDDLPNEAEPVDDDDDERRGQS